MSIITRSAIKRLFILRAIGSRSGCIERYLSDKPYNKSLNGFETKEEKDLSKLKITLKDESGKILGIKSIIESKVLANKLSLNLIEDKPDTKYKYKVFRMVSNRYLAQMDDQTADDNHLPSDDTNNESIHSQKGVKEVKRLVFSTKLDDNDLMTKINATKRWLSRGHQIAIHINNLQKDHKVLENIYNKFETQLKGLAKLNQKKIKSDNTLKFMIVSAQQTTDKSLDGQSVGLTTATDQDIDNLDANTLLSDEFEQQLQDGDKK